MNERMESEELEDVSEQIWRELSTLEFYDGGMREHFAAGLPIYYSDADTPSGLMLKGYPSGKRELVRFSPGGDEVIHAMSDDPELRRVGDEEAAKVRG